MTLHQLKLFVAVAKRKSIKAAAEEFRSAQPTISRQLQLLADDFGVSLHKRIGHGIELTPAGRFLAQEAGRIVSRIEDLPTKISQTPIQNRPLELTVGGSYGPSVKLLPTVLSRFRKIHPEVNLCLRTDSRFVLETLLLDGQLDVVVVNNAVPRAGIVIEPYRTEPTVAFVARNHPLAKEGRLRRSINRRISFVVRRGGIGERYLRNLRNLGFDVEVNMYCDSAEAVKTAVAKSSSIGILSKSGIEHEIKRGAFKRIMLPGEQFLTNSFILHRRNKQVSTIAREFLELLRRS